MERIELVKTENGLFCCSRKQQESESSGSFVYLFKLEMRRRLELFEVFIRERT